MKLFLLALIVASASCLKVQPPTNINIVDEVADCGSSGSIDDVFVQDCTALPCRFRPDNIYEFEIHFTTVQDSEVIHFLVDVFLSVTPIRIIDEAVAVDIKGNQQYSLEYTLLVTDLFFGSINIQFQLMDKMEDHKVICGIADAVVESNNIIF